MLPEGARLRLRANTTISSYSAINQAILTGLKNFGMILADNGSNFFIIGDTDPSWDDSDLGNLDHSITSADFDVIQMAPEYKGMDSSSAYTDYPGTAPTISSFSATATNVSPGSPVTFSFSVTGATYDYIDNIGPVRLSAGSGSVTITPAATKKYTLYATNTSGRAVSSPITVTVTGSMVAPPVFTPPAGSYASKTPLLVTLSTTTARETLDPRGATNATFYYTTDGTTPTTRSTKYNGVSISVAKTQTLKAIAVVPGYSSTSGASSAAYTIGNFNGSRHAGLQPGGGNVLLAADGVPQRFHRWNREQAIPSTTPPTEARRQPTRPSSAIRPEAYVQLDRLLFPPPKPSRQSRWPRATPTAR